MSTSGFGKKIAEYQDELLSRSENVEHDIEAVRRRLFATERAVQSPVRQHWIPLWGYGMAALAACGVLLMLLLHPVHFTGSDEKQSRVASLQGNWIHARESVRNIDFSDQSRIRLSKGAIARILQDEGHHVRILLEQGDAQFKVIHHTDTRWVVDVGPYHVNVIGTQFNLSWDPAAQIFQLKLEEGQVVVYGPKVEEGKRITKDELFAANLAEGTISIRSIGQDTGALFDGNVKNDGSSATDSMTMDTGDTVSSERNNSGKNRKQNYATERMSHKLSQNSSIRTDSRLWQELNRQGKFSDVVQDAKNAGMTAVLRDKPVSELIALGDAARLQREWKMANDAYIGVRNRAPSSADAATAAFSIGRIAFDLNHDYPSAIKWLEIYLHEAPGGRLAREALGRLMEAQEKTGNVAAAHNSANVYLQKYPQGPHAGVARSILQK